MKVLDLRCANGHGFEGWFATDEDFMEQNGRAFIECPLCGNKLISRLPSAPRLNISGASESVAKAQAADLQATWLESVRQIMSRTEDVGERFAEEARRMHYGEEATRGIRGQASEQERAELREEGIETLSIPVPAGLKGPVQ